ncbi:hypothetical protein GIB67_029452, partial [Kingdonia uniflora]
MIHSIPHLSQEVEKRRFAAGYSAIKSDHYLYRYRIKRTLFPKTVIRSGKPQV